MSYVRPPALDTSEYVLKLGTGSFGGTGIERYGPFNPAIFNDGQKAMYCAVWDNRLPGSSPWNVRHFGVIYYATNEVMQASNLLVLTVPDQSAVLGPFTVTDDWDAYLAAQGSGTQQVFYDPAAAGGEWPGGAEVEFYGRSALASGDGSRSETSVQEVFAWVPAEGGGGGGGEGGGDVRCPPRAAYPYQQPGMAVTSTPAGATFISPARR